MHVDRERRTNKNTHKDIIEANPRLSKRPCFIVIILLLFGFHLKNS